MNSQAPPPKAALGKGPGNPDPASPRPGAGEWDFSDEDVGRPPDDYRKGLVKSFDEPPRMRLLIGVGIMSGVMFGYLSIVFAVILDAISIRDAETLGLILAPLLAALSTITVFYFDRNRRL